MNSRPRTNLVPTILVVLGATGDLMKKKIIPSMYHLYTNGRLPDKFHVIGMARRDLSDSQFRKTVASELRRRVSGAKAKQVKDVSNFFSYQKGTFKSAAAFASLKKELDKIDAKWGVCTNKLFYLAVPPEHFADIFNNMAQVGLNKACGGALGWTRILIEKPFGENVASAKELFSLLKRFFEEEQLYLIDHYLAKEIIQAITHFRFTNNLFEKSWDTSSIERIDVRLLETIGAEDRGAFYDAVGALRDVGQNHLLQMLAAATMDVPSGLEAAQLRSRRADILEQLLPWTARTIKKNTFRSQYDTYTSINGVKGSSKTETYAKLKTELSHPSWRGVPIVLEAGKRMKRAIKEMEVTFRHPSLCVACQPGKHIHNKVVFRMEPDDRITIHFWTKTPGFEKDIEERVFTFFLHEREQKAQYVEEYAELLYAACTGDQSMFVSQKEVEAQWRFTDPVVEAWKKNAVPLHRYTPDSDEAALAAQPIGQYVDTIQGMQKDMGIVGLGKMGASMAKRMMEKGWRIVGFNRSPDTTDALAKDGLVPAYSLKEVADQLPKKKVIWLMVPSGKPVNDVLFGKDGLATHLKRGDVVIDGGNSFYKDTIARAKKLKKYGIKYLDAGTSGGPSGARQGACLMIGGKKKDFQAVEQVFRDFAMADGYQFFDGHGAGHFVKMVHNGIEYGMMQAIAEGFTIMKKARFGLDLTRIADVYNHGSVIESRLVGWLKDAFELFGEDLKPISGSVQQLGEGAWTVKTAKEMKLKAKVIKDALQFRYDSEKDPNYTGKVVSALRGRFGGHAVKKKK
jgi:glucose-6-phosphate 1-dehydrogenase/6-phosphogluconate dehydrogenase (decarboxylating)